MKTKNDIFDYDKFLLEHNQINENFINDYWKDILDSLNYFNKLFILSYLYEDFRKHPYTYIIGALHEDKK